MAKTGMWENNAHNNSKTNPTAKLNNTKIKNYKYFLPSIELHSFLLTHPKYKPYNKQANITIAFKQHHISLEFIEVINFISLILHRP